MFLRCATLTLVCALVPSSIAAAQEQPSLDPDSPAGVEYQLPLDQAREDASGGGSGGGSSAGGGGGPGSAPAPLFGAGIQPEDGGAGPGAEGESDSGVNGKTIADSGQDGRQVESETPSAGPPAVTAASAGAGSASGDVLIPGLALAVLLAGGALGFALRRGLGQSPTW